MGPKGKRLRGTVPFGHWKTSTLIGGLRNDRISPLTAGVFNGPISCESVCLRYHLDNAGCASASRELSGRKGIYFV